MSRSSIIDHPLFLGFLSLAVAQNNSKRHLANSLLTLPKAIWMINYLQETWKMDNLILKHYHYHILYKIILN